MNLKIRIFPQEIVTQIVLLVILSAIIFHLCISAAFFIGRGYPESRTAAFENRFVTRIADFMKMANAQPASARENMLAWLADTDPRLGLKLETVAPPASDVQNDQLIEAMQSHVGSDMKVDRVETDDNKQRIGFRFADGTFVSMEIPSYPPLPGGFAGRPPPPPPPPMIQVIFGTLLFIAISFTIFLLWAVRGVMRPLRRFATTVDDFTVEGTMTVLEENGPSELRGAARALNRMRERVKAMLEQRTQMLAAISHDLRTPITRMRLRAEFIDLQDIREPILRDIEQMDAMVNSAMSFIRDGVQVQRNTLLDLSALIQTVCDEFVDMGHRVTCETPGPTSINGNSDELYRAVVNLVSNAVRFGTEVQVYLRRAGRMVEIDVSDDGPGISDELKASMLAPFARGDTARPLESPQGFGLGLPIVQAIVKAHRGALTLLDRSPHGLTARMELPFKKSSDA
jgi:signal transduction histidine kinase